MLAVFGLQSLETLRSPLRILDRQFAAPEGDQGQERRANCLQRQGSAAGGVKGYFLPYCIGLLSTPILSISHSIMSPGKQYRRAGTKPSLGIQ